MAGIATNFIAECKEELEYRKQEKEQLLDQLKLYDVRIDRYDAIIENMDKSLLPLITEINDAIDVVQDAYEARIAAGCKSDLYWEETSRVPVKVFFKGLSGGLGGNLTYDKVTYTVKKNPSVRTIYNRYGIKYYRRPKNQDYGSNIVAEFFGSISAGSTVLAIRQTGLAGTAGILLGDTITDDLENPITFGIDDLPEIVGFGVSTILIDNFELGGKVTVGSTVLAHVGVGTTGDVQIGAGIGYTGTLPYNTTIVGIGTTTTDSEEFDDVSGTFITTSITVPSLILSQPSIASTTVNFTIGISSDYPAYIMSTECDIAAEFTNFTVIRTTQSVLDEFDPSNNPIDPVTVGIMNTSSIGLGHTAILVNNGSSEGPFQWREVLGEYDPEPACGNGTRVWYFGNTSWPTKTVSGFSTTFPWTGISTVVTYANEGDQVVINVGAAYTYPNLYSFGTSGTSPTNPSLSGCGDLDAAIVAAEASRDAIIAKNVPVIEATLSAAAGLRKLRDKLEGTAFCFLQGRAAADAEIVRLTNAVADLESIDLSQFEPTEYREANRFSSDTTGIATS